MVPPRYAVLKQAHAKTGRRAVVLVDEYDKPILQTLQNEKLQEDHRNQLKAYYSVLKPLDRYIKFAFLTGVTKFSKISVFNDLNNLMDISKDYRYVNICGTTEEELKSYLKEGISELASANGVSESETIDKLRMRYGGYHFEKNSEGIYNPFSVLNTLAKHRYKNYWFETGTPTFLIELLKEHGYRLPDLSKEQVSANVMSSMDSSFPNPIPVIYQSGYLTIKGYDERFKKYQLGFPNKEVEEGFLNLLLPLYNSAGDRSSFMVDELEA